MSRFFIHQLNDTEFEDLVTLICRQILGSGVTSFAPGPDGGKDAKFEGTAIAFPSTTAPVAGKFIIQAKHTSNPVASCSDYDFETKSVEKEEIPKIKRQFDEGRLTHYLIFTNRRKTGGAEDRIPDRIKAKTGVQYVWLRGLEDIERDLLHFPGIVKLSGLYKLRSPIQFMPDDIRDVIVAFHKHRNAVATAFDSQYDFRDYPGLPRKNEINGLTETYFREHILKDSEPRFPEIRRFLENPRNWELAEQYHAVANELKGQIITHREQFIAFDDALEHVYHLMHERNTELQSASRRILTKIFIHYMYVNCDIGIKDL
ncbi:MAG: ABC-three component system protein [Desulfurivibrionaceae bacterium]|jgi:hypothetical protein|nr:hypothetical protein [Desulfurivibrionaceae bacterium]